ncbi:MAG: 3-deoxy-8-phosphooctulonate synthase [Thermodesulfobacteriota bacterium]
MERHTVRIGDLSLGENAPFFVIAGPCVIESEETTFRVADYLRETADSMGIPLVFKASYDKANRTSLDSYRGPGLDAGLDILHKVRERTGLRLISDVHSAHEVEKAARVLDVLQVPAFLCRQTDLLVAASSSGLPVNLKKGQFMAPWDMEQAVLKVVSGGNRNILLTERGVSFGYNNLVVDIRAIPVMQAFGYPVVFDATHSVQLPGAAGGSSGGQREYVEVLARAAVAAGADGVFMEVHPRPEEALCDGPNAVPMGQVRSLLALLREIHALVKNRE